MPPRTGPRRKKRQKTPEMPRLPERTWRVTRPHHAGLHHDSVAGYRDVTANWLIAEDDGRLVFINNDAMIVHMIAAGAWTEVGIVSPFERFIPVNAEQAQSILAEMTQTFAPREIPHPPPLNEDETDAEHRDAPQESQGNDPKA